MRSIGCILIVAFVCVNCVFTGPKDPSPEMMDEDWEDLISGASVDFEPKPDQRFDILMTSERLALLPENIRSNDEKSALTLSRFLEKPELFDLGVYGKVDGAGRFVAYLSDIPDWDRLYWAQVQVLSKKYACFIRERFKNGDEVKFQCRDKRYVTMWRARGDHWIEFYARLYDMKGKEIITAKGKDTKKPGAVIKSSY